MAIEVTQIDIPAALGHFLFVSCGFTAKTMGEYSGCQRSTVLFWIKPESWLAGSEFLSWGRIVRIRFIGSSGKGKWARGKFIVIFQKKRGKAGQENLAGSADRTGGGANAEAFRHWNAKPTAPAVRRTGFPPARPGRQMG